MAPKKAAPKKAAAKPAAKKMAPKGPREKAAEENAKEASKRGTVVSTKPSFVSSPFQSRPSIKVAKSGSVIKSSRGNLYNVDSRKEILPFRKDKTTTRITPVKPVKKKK
jgi:hypothetical protein